MERSLYTREEIAAFADEHLKILEVPGAGVDPDRVHERYVQSITLLPPWQQVLLIESRAVSVVGDAKSIQYIYNKIGGKKAVEGFFQPGDLTVAFNDGERLQGRNMVFWRVDVRGGDSRSVQAHEYKHRDDWLMGEKEGQPQTYYSSQNPVLKQALANEMRHREERRAQGRLPPLPPEGVKERGLLAWLNKCLARPGGGTKAPDADDDIIRVGEKLYDDYREIEDHLALYEDTSSHEIEAFAEMAAHHTMLYARYNGDEAAVDRVLKMHYPHYWPAYRDIAIPEMEKRAEQLWEQRQERIDAYAMAAWVLADVRGEEFDEPSVRQAAAMASAKGFVAHEMRKMDEQRALYERPIEPAMRAFQDLVEMNWYALTPMSEQRSKPYTFEYEDIRKQMEDRLDEVGIHAFVDYVRDLRREVRELAEFSSAEERFARNLGLPDIESGSARAFEVIDRFNKIMSEEGLDGVKAYRLSLPSRDAVNSYVIARTGWQETRDSLHNEDAVIVMTDMTPSLEVMEKELRTLAAAGGRDAVMRARDEIRNETRALSNYYSRLSMIAESIGRLTGEKPPYIPGAEILERYDGLVDKGGLQAVRAEIVRLTVPVNTMVAYATAREDSESARVSIEKDGGDISWGRKDGLYRPFSVAVNQMAKGFMAQVAQDMRELVMEGGAEALISETKRLQQETHRVVAQAIGKPIAQGTGMG